MIFSPSLVINASKLRCAFLNLSVCPLNQSLSLFLERSARNFRVSLLIPDGLSEESSSSSSVSEPRLLFDLFLILLFGGGEASESSLNSKTMFSSHY